MTSVDDLQFMSPWINHHQDERDETILPAIAKQLGSAADSITQLGRELLGDVRQFVNGNAQSDDMCLVCFGRE
jgi:serine phosphatase RsbU (regulator of sigma subunit)